MDKQIIDLLMSKSYITNIGVDHIKYDSIDDLINQGVVTIPGAREKIDELLKSMNISAEPVVETEPVVEEDTIKEAKKSKKSKKTE